MTSVGRIPLQPQDPNIQLTDHVHKKVEVSKVPVLAEPGQTETAKHDVPYFRNLLQEEGSRLTELCESWKECQENIGDVDDAEQILGEIRTVVGQAHLIMSERFVQFEGLVDHCEHGTGEKPVTCEDLQGFWDMIYFQVEDVEKKFAKLKTRRENKWKKLTSETTVVKKRKSVKKVANKANAVTSQARREEARKRLAAAKAALRKETQDSVSFDAGFFKVDSPVRKVVERSMRTPHSKERKRSATPSSDNFMHGRFLRKAMGNTATDMKKTLSFENLDGDFESKKQKIEENKNPSKPESPEKEDCISNATISRQTKISLKNACTNTDPDPFSTISKAVEVINEKMREISEAQRNLENNSTQVKVQVKVEEKAELKSKQNDSNEQSSLPQNGDAYEPHYKRMVEKVKLLQAELSSYHSLKQVLIESKEKWKYTFRCFSEKLKDVEEFNLQLSRRDAKLKEKEGKENEELLTLRNTCLRQSKEIEILKKKSENFDEISEKLGVLTECNNQQAKDYENLQETCELIRKEKNNLQSQHASMCDDIENLQTELKEMKAARLFVEEEFSNEKSFLEEEKKLLQTQLSDTEEMLNKLQEISKSNRNEIVQLKESLDSSQKERQALQEECDIVKSNCRLAILEQEENLIYLESRMQEMLVTMTTYFRRLQKKNPGGLKLENLPSSLTLAPKTPSKSLVASALLRSDGENIDSPEVKVDGTLHNSLLSTVNDVSAVFKSITDLSSNIAFNYDTEMEQLLSDKNSLAAKVKLQNAEIENHKKDQDDVAMGLRRRLNDVISQRDERIKEVETYKEDLLKLSLRYGNMTGQK